jgi:hypothetical protein
MKRKIRLLGEWQTIRDKMDGVEDRPYEGRPIAKEQGIWQRVEKLPKFEGTGRRSLGSRSNRNIKSF